MANYFQVRRASPSVSFSLLDYEFFSSISLILQSLSSFYLAKEMANEEGRAIEIRSSDLEMG